MNNVSRHYYSAENSSCIFSPFNKCNMTWLEDWREFFRIRNLFPDLHHDVPEQFNCLTRILVLMILILYVLHGYNIYVMTLIMLLLAVIIFYFALYKSDTFSPMKETYDGLMPQQPPPPSQPQPPQRSQPLPSTSQGGRTPLYACSNNSKNTFFQESIINYDSQKPDEPIIISGNNWNPSLIDVQQSGTWCKDPRQLDATTASLNQSLVGGANPKTHVIPVIPPPIYDGETWMPNDFIVPYKINDQHRQELWQNGYMTWGETNPKASSELYGKYGCVQRPPQQMYPQPQQPQQPQQLQQPQQPQQPQVSINQSQSQLQRPQLREDYINPTLYGNAQYNQPFNESVATGESMDTSFGYYPENSQYGYPVNMPPTGCMKSKEMSEYNRNLFTIPLQPNVYTRSQVNQPDASMSNLGISFTQPHLPYTCEMDDRGNMIIDEYDPNQYPSEYLLKGRDQFANDADMIPRNEIYDPRLTGYGTSYRSYIDDLTGRPKFYYDDVDAHTQYNYITRNKIDFTNFGQSAGPYKENQMTCGTRQLADLTFHNDAMKQRTELQYRLMAKNSHREWQQRAAPIQTQGFGKAGCGLPFASSYAGPRGM